MSIVLNSIQRRVLGVLLEKSLALPQYYPMTVNALVTGCNQKQNRDPVMELDEDSVWDALEGLRKENLIHRIGAGAGSRTDKFKHNVAEVWGWQAQQRAIMAELMLRGPQTVAELRTRCSRMTEFDALELVTGVLQALSSAETPFVRLLPRQPGQSAIRWAHTLYESHESVVTTYENETTDSQAAMISRVTTTTPTHDSVGSAGRIAALEREIESLRNEVADLREQIAHQKHRLDAIL